MIRNNNQIEFGWNADRAFNGKASTGLREISNGAVDRAAAELNFSGL